MADRIRPIAEKCVDELLGYTLRPPMATATQKMVAAARRVALRDLSAEQLRMLITQGEGVTYLLPFALSHLERDPLVETSFQRGDLLGAVLDAEAFWVSRPELRDRIRAVIEQALTRLAAVRPVDVAAGGLTERHRTELEPRLRTALTQIDQAGR